jgi:hypothetical protein
VANVSSRKFITTKTFPVAEFEFILPFLDISDELMQERFISKEFLGTFFKFFVVTDIPKETPFATTTRNEIQVCFSSPITLKYK